MEKEINWNSQGEIICSPNGKYKLLINSIGEKGMGGPMTIDLLIKCEDGDYGFGRSFGVPFSWGDDGERMAAMVWEYSSQKIGVIDFAEKKLFVLKEEIRLCNSLRVEGDNVIFDGIFLSDKVSCVDKIMSIKSDLGEVVDYKVIR